MKTFSKLLVVIVVLLTACGEGDETAMQTLASRELLMKYDWITFSVVRDPGSDVEPDLVEVVWSFDESDCSVSDYDGTFYNLGSWSVTDDEVMLGRRSYPILELTTKKFIYEAHDGAIITRLPLRK